jgi:hypothetical protein
MMKTPKGVVVMKPPGDTMKRKWVEVVCPVCGEKFSQRPDGRPVTCSRSCARRLQAQKNGGHSPNYKGGRWMINTGYWKVLKRDHPRADAGGYVLEHILVMEAKIGRHLHPWETIHHKNGVRSDNSPDNLELWFKKDPPGQRVYDLMREFMKQPEIDGMSAEQKSAISSALGRVLHAGD